jgi:5'(3')-deoxyribonucleotidase
MTNKRIFVDMDGVLTDFVGSVCKLFNYNDAWPYGEYDINKVIGQSIWPRLEQEGRKFWSEMDKTDECNDLMSMLVGKDYYICTSPTMDPQSAAGKLEWLRKYFPHAFKNRRFVITPWKHFLTGTGNVLIDDSDDQIASWKKAGGIGILLPRPWNALHGETDTLGALQYLWE